MEHHWAVDYLDCQHFLKNNELLGFLEVAFSFSDCRVENGRLLAISSVEPALTTLRIKKNVHDRLSYAIL